jgi:hypothetical protein
LRFFGNYFVIKRHADAPMLMAIKRHKVALVDQELRTLIHHILVSHRFWIHLSQGLPFNVEMENVVPATLDELAARFQATQMQELAWLDRLQAFDLARYRGRGPHASVPTQPRTPRSVCHATSKTGRRTAASRLHPLGEGSARSDLGLISFFGSRAVLSLLHSSTGVKMSSFWEFD